MSESEIVTEIRGACALATLNRPKALNALSHGMIKALDAALSQWEADPSIACVALRGATARAFCAGADIRALYELGRAGAAASGRAAQLAYFRDEYRLDRKIARFSKPVVALVEGVVMGGGAGLAVNARHCVAGDAVVFAMPETGIGFFPDVGATRFLSRLPGALGPYLALTGARIATGDMTALGLAGAHVASARHEALIERLGAGEAPAAAIAAEADPAPPSALLEERAVVDRCFSAGSVVEIADRLAADPSDFARAALSTLESRSPTSLAVAFRQMRAGAGLSIEAALALEFRIVARILAGHDYYEGVRAVIVDKDQSPHWRPAELDGPGEADVEAYFAPLKEELTFPAPAPAC
ncbi:enoyl-CoA hydratase/isomerase family protein [Methylocella sp.]|uniref:enoyl-CoA hydratase/isomerase family protein n=1 Tax=Methylocella sp. TaxID=1978226 RepID=UPI0037848B50